MAKKINGITIAINADTSGVTAGLKDLTSQSVSLSKQLKSVNALLKVDPKNTELLKERKKILEESIDTTKKKLKELESAQKDVQKAYKSGSIGKDEYIAFQKELVETKSRLKDLKSQSDETGFSMSKLGSVLKDGVEVAAKAAAASLAGVTAAAVGTASAVASAAADLALQSDEILDNSQNLGMSAEAYQEWDFIMQHTSGDIDKMTTSMKKLATTVEEPTEKSTEAFRKLGISIEDAKNMSQEDLFAATITALQGMESGTERTALANDLLGKSAMDLGVLLNTSAEETQYMREQAHLLGAVLDDETLEAGDAFADSLQDMKTAIGGVKNEALKGFIPSMTQMMNSVTQIASGNMDAVAGLEMGMDRFVENIEKMAEDIADKADQIIPVIIKVVSKALPKLAKSAVKIIETLGGAIVKNLPQIIKAAGEILSTLVKGIGQKLPTLIPAAIKMLMELVDGLLDHMDIIIDGALALVTGLAEGIINSLPVLIEKAPEIVSKLVDGIVEALPKIFDAGVQIIGELFDFFSNGENLKNMLTAGLKIIVKICAGIKNAFFKLVEKGREIIPQIWDGLKEKIGEAVEWGREVIMNFLQGCEEAFGSSQWWTFWDDFGQFIYDMFHPFNGEQNLQVSQRWDEAYDPTMMNPDYKPLQQNGSPMDYVKMTGAKGVPIFGSGGVVNVPTKAIIGENGAEVVMPLEHNTAWIDKLAARINRSGGGYSAQINVTVYGNDMSNIGNTIAEKIDTALRRYQVQQVRGQGGTAWAT